MTRAAIYARYSSELQKARSIEDQVALCRQYAAREGLEVAAVYDDRALSGGSLHGRDGLARMLADAADGRFDVVIVEALDRLSRDMADLATIYKRLDFQQIRILAVHEGAANEMAVALRGLLGQLFRKDLKDKVRRGQAGRARAGKIAGGLAYGYAAVPGQPGERTIVEEEAETVRRIFRDFASGRSTRDIARGLNADGIRPPQGRAWCGTTLYGGPKRGGGMLRNEAYRGRIVWNRVPEIRDPETNRRTTRPSRQEDRVTADAPHLRIVSDEQWDAVTARLPSVCGRAAPLSRNRISFLSGLLRCHSCGAGLASRGRCPNGRPRVGCSRHAESGDCPAPQSYYLDTIERGVLSALKDGLTSPAAIREFLRCYREERARLAAGAGDRARGIARRLTAIEGELERITDFLIRGIGNEKRLDARAKALAAEEERLRIEAAMLPAAPERVEMDGGVLQDYRREIERLERGLTERLNMASSPGALMIRDMIGRVTPRRAPGAQQIVIEIEGQLPHAWERPANILGGKAGGPGGTSAIPPRDSNRTPYKLTARAG